MRLRSSSRTSSRTARRGFTLTEVMVASSLILTVMTTVASVLSVSGRMEQGISAQNSTDQGAVRAMNHMTLEVREAKEVQVLAPHRFRIYYPVTDGSGHYDRFQADYSHWVEYYQSDAAGTPNGAGGYLWRKTDTDAGRIIVKNVNLIRVDTTTPHSIRLTVELRKKVGSRTGITNLTDRVLYLRNN